MNARDIFKYWNKTAALMDNAGRKWGEGELNCMPLPGKNCQSWFLVLQSDQIFEGVFGIRIDLTDEMIAAIAIDASGHLSLKLPRLT